MQVALSAPEWIEVAVALGTGWLGYQTWRLAQATRGMSESSDQQLAELRRHADAAEASVEQGQQTMEATMEPRLRILRSDGDKEIAVVDRDGTWGVTVENDKPVPATIEEATLGHNPKVFLAAIPRGPLELREKSWLKIDNLDAQVVERLRAAKSLPLVIQYEGPSGKPRHTRAQIRHKAPDRWIVVEKEEDASHGGGVASW